MVLGTHPAKPYLRRIWFAPFELLIVRRSARSSMLGAMARDGDWSWTRDYLSFTAQMGPVL